MLSIEIQSVVSFSSLLGTGGVKISIFSFFFKIEHFVQHISHKTLVGPMAIHYTNAFKSQNYFSITAQVSVHVLLVI